MNVRDSKFGMLARLHMFIIWGLCSILTVNAQNKLKVLSAEDGLVVPGAAVMLNSVDGSTGIIVGDDGFCTIPAGWFSDEGTIGVRIHALSLTDKVLVLRNLDATLEIKLEPLINELDQFVVTGQYRESDPRKAVHRIRVISAEQIQAMSANNIADVLAGEFNIRLGQDNILGSSISMQGLSGQNVKILVDGVPVIGRLNGNVDLSQMLLGGVQRIEVVEGPLSVNYGTNALAGTINIITRDSVGRKKGIRFHSYAEHIGRLNLAGSYNNRGNRNAWSVDLARNFFAGWDPSQEGIPDFSPTLADSSRRQQWKPREQYSGRLNYTWYKNRWSFGYKGELMQDHILNRGYPRAPQATTAFDEEYDTRRLDNALFADRKSANSKWNLLLAHNRFRRVRNTYFKDLTTLESNVVDAQGMQDTSVFSLSNGRYSYASISDSSKFNWEVGADLNHETVSGQRIEDGTEKSITDVAIYASAQIEAVSGLLLRPGLRIAYNSEFDAPVTPALNTRWRLNDDYTFRASYARGFRAPSLKELYMYFVDVNHNIIGNTELLAETSDNASFSVVRSEVSKGVRSEFELAGSYNVVKNMINLAGINATEYTYVNVGEVNTISGRISFRQHRKKLDFLIGFGFTSRSDQVSGVAPVTDYYFVPETSARLTYRFMKGWLLNANYRFQGNQKNYTYVGDVDLTEGILGEYHLADMSVARKVIADRMRIAIGVKDLLNTQNISLTGASGGGHASGADSSPLTTGRTYFVKLELEIE